MRTIAKPLSFLFMIIITLSACSNNPKHTTIEEPFSYQHLLKDDFFLKPGENSTLQDVNVLELSDALKELMDKKVKHLRTPYRRAERLRQLLFRTNELGITYGGNQSQTATEVFQSREANCISFSNLFVALARYVDLPATYQRVYAPPVWNKENNSWIINYHINVTGETVINSKKKRVYNRYISPGIHNLTHYISRKTYTVDINPLINENQYQSRSLTDMEAKSLFYSNYGAESLLEGDLKKAYLYTKKAINIDPKSSVAWNNLGIIYQRSKQPKLAEQVYQFAIRWDKYEYTAKSNLARLYTELKQQEKAKPLLQSIHKFRNQNPYYHYMLGENSYKKGNYKESLKHTKNALKLKNNSHEFYYTRAKAYAALGEIKLATHNLELAKSYAKGKDKKRYSGKVQRLNALTIK